MFSYIYVNITTHAYWCTQRAEEGMDLLELEFTNVYELPPLFWESNLFFAGAGNILNP